MRRPHKVGLWGCKELRQAKSIFWVNKDLSAADLALLDTLGSVLPALESLILSEPSAAARPDDGVQRQGGRGWARARCRP